eukprot:TRINITY_DN48128_c0_g1_i1.p1 TRINITY_DN48128_c0_g1~~TRINITY_DN48128_c0_g1_i1.p1  ORF type:complete len:548 (+),score=64.95 TRINITY_DN48128_c0_g1_i1:51-1646(+)
MLRCESISRDDEVLRLIEVDSVDRGDQTKDESDGSEATWLGLLVWPSFAVLPLLLLLVSVKRWIFGRLPAGAGAHYDSATTMAEQRMNIARGNLSAVAIGGLELASGMVLPNKSLLEEYHHQAYCRNTPQWANGFPCVDEGKTAEQGCTLLGWTCAGYTLNGLCSRGQTLVSEWAFGRGVQFPELNCCECGGKVEKGGSCKKYGCNEAYDRTLLCQCNLMCREHRNCCWDYTTLCMSRLPIGSYLPRDPVLLMPSTAPTQTIYVYRAQTNETFMPALANVNAASLGAVLWYLHNEVVHNCPRRGSIYSKYDITRILRYRVTHKATQPLFDRGMNYGPFCAFDYAACRGPGNRHGEDWARYGYNIGCERVGDWPHEQFGSAKAYPNAIWYSLPGPCPNEDLPHKNRACIAQEPGGLSEDSDPTGAGNSTFTFESAGEVHLDELVGIAARWSSHESFCREGCSEYLPHLNRGTCGLHFWDHRWDKESNAKRVRQTDDLFFRRYPNLPRDRDIPTPRCDFNKRVFYEDHMPSPP